MIKRITLSLSLVVGLLCTSQAQLQMFFSSDSLSNITSPLDVDSLFYWFAADVGVTDSLGGAIATDEGVGTWNDLSGNGYHVTQSTDGARPVYKATGGPGSKPCIQFDGTDDFLASAAHWWGSDDLTVFVVMKFGNATRNARETVMQKGDFFSSLIQFSLSAQNTASSYNIWFRAGSSGTTLYDNRNGPKFSNFQSLTSVHFGTTSTGVIFKNSTAQAMTYAGTTPTIQDNADHGLVLGAANPSSLTDILQGSISEIIVYSRALTATERTAIENYLNRKYDLY